MIESLFPIIALLMFVWVYQLVKTKQGYYYTKGNKVYVMDKDKGYFEIDITNKEEAKK